MSSEASQIDTVQDVFIKFAFIENKHFFTKSFHRQTSQNYEQPPQRFVLSKSFFCVKNFQKKKFYGGYSTRRLTIIKKIF